MDLFEITQRKEYIMAMKTLTAKFTGISPLLQNNPQPVDAFNKYAKLKKPLTAKRTKTDEDLLLIRRIDVEGKVYFNDEMGIYIPSGWVMAGIAKNSHAIAKISKAKIRGAVFPVVDKMKLTYDGMKLVKSKIDIVDNDKFITTLILPQQQVRLAKSFPIFHKWSFEVELEYDDVIVDFADMKRILEYTAKYSGFGDFRPTYGRCLCKVTND